MCRETFNAAVNKIPGIYNEHCQVEIEPLEGSTIMPGIMLRTAKIPTRMMMRSFKESFKESMKGGLCVRGLLFLPYLYAVKKRD